ncbi:MAG TPA: serine/threonine-protein kinase [Thermoanaerobaculia bacterium]|nr:serine/threonine-protein kinase [Thermoanaerobaculia bacterium]
MACTSCGFERIEEGRSCPVCGAATLSGTVQRDSDATIERDRAQPASAGVLREGDLFAERYQIEATLGRGGMGVVYRVVDRTTGDRRALKVLHAGAADGSAAARFKREISILSRIDHPAILRIFDWGVTGQRMYLASELLDGADLRQHLRSRIAFPPAEVARTGGRLAEALAVAHRHGVVHRDIKPHNVMVCGDGTLKLLDFGIARGAGIELNTVTTSGVMVGTPEYMSPEQFVGERVDVRSDIYSLGVVLYELTVGALPFTADTPVALGIQHQTRPVPPIRGERPGVPAWLERIILKCLQKRPADRFQTAGDLAVELQRLRRGEKRTRTLPSGDQVVEDDSEAEPWALTIRCAAERTPWTRGMALFFDGRHYCLEEIGFTRAGGERWIYRFSHWPAEQIFRKMIDYEQDVAERHVASGLGARLRRWFS